MFVKRIDGRGYVFRLYWDAAAPGSHYWIVVEATPEPEATPFPSEPIPEEVVSKVHRLLEKWSGFPNVPAPEHQEEENIVRFRVRLTRTPNGARPRKASDWMKALEKAIQVEL